MIIACGRSWLYSKVFNFWGTCRLPSFSTRHLQAPKNNPGTFHRPAGAQRLRRPAWKRTIPLWFHDVPHGWRPEAFTRQHASMADSRQNDTWPAQPNGLHLKLARASSALCHDPIISHRVRGMRNKNQFISVYGQINVYGVTTKSERHKRSYWTRTADGNGIGGRKAPVPYGS